MTNQAFTFPAFDLYREFKNLTITAGAERVKSVSPAHDADRIIAAFRSSGGRYRPPESIVDEAFDPGKRVVLKGDDARLALRLQAVSRITVGSAEREHVGEANVSTQSLRYQVCGHEVFLTRALKKENRIDGAEKYKHWADLILRVEGEGIPAVCEVKSRGDKDAMHALVQAMAYAAFASSPVMGRRIRAQLPGFDTSASPPRVDVVLCIQHLNTSPERCLQLEHAMSVAPLLLASREVARSVRRIVCLDFSDLAVDEASLTGELICDLLFAFGATE